MFLPKPEAVKGIAQRVIFNDNDDFQVPNFVVYENNQGYEVIIGSSEGNFNSSLSRTQELFAYEHVQGIFYSIPPDHTISYDYSNVSPSCQRDDNKQTYHIAPVLSEDVSASVSVKTPQIQYVQPIEKEGTIQITDIRRYQSKQTSTVSTIFPAYVGPTLLPSHSPVISSVVLDSTVSLNYRKPQVASAVAYTVDIPILAQGKEVEVPSPLIYKNESFVAVEETKENLKGASLIQGIEYQVQIEQRGVSPVTVAHRETALVKIFQVLAPVQLLKSSSIGFFSLALRKIPNVSMEELHKIGAKTTFSPEPRETANLNTTSTATMLLSLMGAKTYHSDAQDKEAREAVVVYTISKDSLLGREKDLVTCDLINLESVVIEEGFENHFRLHEVNKGSKTLEGILTMIDNYSVKKSDISSSSQPYVVTALVDSKTGPRKDVEINANSALAIMDKLLHQLGANPQYKITVFAAGGKVYKQVELRGISEYDNQALQHFGVKTNAYIGMLGFINGEEPELGTKPLDEITVKEGDTLSLAYIHQGVYNGGYGKSTSSSVCLGATVATRAAVLGMQRVFAEQDMVVAGRKALSVVNHYAAQEQDIISRQNNYAINVIVNDKTQQVTVAGNSVLAVMDQMLYRNKIGLNLDARFSNSGEVYVRGVFERNGAAQQKLGNYDVKAVVDGKVVDDLVNTKVMAGQDVSLMYVKR
ncbi:hypothetical protein HYY69_06265 [Candidatus Woesearchaeota archaeon]|nr:hypothetical protein [Candidatus Woesearchaeota archaeon]